MLDLEQPRQQTEIEVAGRWYPVETSFRAWLRFGRVLAEHGVCDPCVMRCKPPEGWQGPAEEFYRSPVPTPRPRGSSGPRALDLWADQDYIAGSFMSSYGIDLTTAELHWHVFLALLRSLPEDAKLSRIMSWRTWDAGEARRSEESVRRELRELWALPDAETPQRRALAALQAEWFGDVRIGGDGG